MQREEGDGMIVTSHSTPQASTRKRRPGNTATVGILARVDAEPRKETPQGVLLKKRDHVEFDVRVNGTASIGEGTIISLNHRIANVQFGTRQVPVFISCLRKVRT